MANDGAIRIPAETFGPSIMEQLHREFGRSWRSKIMEAGRHLEPLWKTWLKWAETEQKKMNTVPPMFRDPWARCVRKWGCKHGRV